MVVKVKALTKEYNKQLRDVLVKVRAQVTKNNK
jgi:hypothetical protein